MWYLCIRHGSKAHIPYNYFGILTNPLSKSHSYTHSAHTYLFKKFFPFYKSSLNTCLVTIHLLDVNQLNWDPVKVFYSEASPTLQFRSKTPPQFLKAMHLLISTSQEVLMPSVLPQSTLEISWDLLLTHLHTTPRRINSIRLFKK